MLHEFITTHRDELIARCRSKSAERALPLPDSALDDGVGRFMDQLAGILREEWRAGDANGSGPLAAATPAELGSTAARHGEHLLKHGFSVDQVVHEYGDVCQAVSDLALALDAPFSTAEFRTLNRCLDNAIAVAVTAHGAQTQHLIADREASLHLRLRGLTADYQRIVAVAIHAYSAIKTGHVGVTGATGALLGHSLAELSYLAVQSLPPMVDALSPAAD